MTFIKPMLAHKATPKMEFARKTWTVEEKFDGHRLIVSVQNGAVTAWSRKGLERALPPHVLADLVKLPDGTYDGELITKGGRSYDVVNKERAADRQFVIFDILRLLNRDITGQAYVHRRMYLREIFDKLKKVGKGIWLSPAWAVDTWNEAMGICREIWDRDGEGIILKRSAGSYHPGMRTKEFLKVKALKHATLVVTGFRPSKGEKINRGPFAIALLRDNKGNETKVKVLDDATLADLKRAWKARKRGATKHPYVGRKLCIEYQERTPDGGYRHPRWDRWEDE
jgi:bifunctional non-homologous end joining protein LigD